MLYDNQFSLTTISEETEKEANEIWKLLKGKTVKEILHIISVLQQNIETRCQA